MSHTPRIEVPTATYRLQLRQGMNLARAAALVPYLAKLGIEHVYLSPVFAAYSGSTHGTDVIDPNRIDPELGGREGFDWLIGALQRAGMGVLLDIVPNHMRAHADNLWWRDVLEHGIASRFAPFFDLRWSADVEHRVVLPILGEHYCEALERGDLVPDRDGAGLVVRYHEFIAPLDPRTWPVVLDRAAALATDPRALVELADECRALPPRTVEAREQRARATLRLGARLRAALQWPDLATAIDKALRELRGTPGDPASTSALHALLDAQVWRAAYWRSGLGELNYRRFFDVAELVGLRSEKDEVFVCTHELLGELLGCAVPVGVRVDHVDGLADARGYLRRLREIGVSWLVVDKILGEGEALRGDWPCDGTTGYEVAAAITRTFVDPDGAALLHAAWRERNGGVELADAAREAKLHVLDSSFEHTLRSLAADLRKLTLSDRRARDVSLAELERALRELTVSLPVYRTYVEPSVSGGIDRELLAGAVERAATRLIPDDRLALEFIARVVRSEPEWTDERAVEVATIVRRWQQLTSPVAAKGLEDTLLFRWTALGALAEVGAPLELPVAPVDELHQMLRRRRRTQRAPLVATTTHDTKYGEDTRARLGVLSQLAAPWLAIANEAAKHLADDPADRDEVEVLLQAFVGSWPNDPSRRVDYPARLHDVTTKMVREAKRRSDWMRPCVEHEARAHARVDALLAALDTTDWGRKLAALQQRVAFFGAHDSLAQLVLKLAAPGVCDVFQGTELWDLTMVDPDNRRPIDFDERVRLLEVLQGRHREGAVALLGELREQWTDGRIKALVLWRGLQLRREHRALLLDGEIRPLEIGGARNDCACAFARRNEGDHTWLVAAVTRTTSRLVEPPRWPIGGACWRDEAVLLPEDAPSHWTDGWTGAPIVADGGRLPLAQIFADLPCALLVGSG